MKITYDSKVDALYSYFLDKPPEVTTHRLTEEVAIDYAPNGQIAGIEVLHASEYVFTPNPPRRVEVHHLIPIAA